MNQLRQLITEQVEAMKRYEVHSQQFVSEQQEECAHNQHTQFQQFDSALRDKDLAIQTLKQELANNKERSLLELEQARQDAERMAQQDGSKRATSLCGCAFHSTLRQTS